MRNKRILMIVTAYGRVDKVGEKVIETLMLQSLFCCNILQIMIQ